MVGRIRRLVRWLHRWNRGEGFGRDGAWKTNVMYVIESLRKIAEMDRHRKWNMVGGCCVLLG